MKPDRPIGIIGLNSLGIALAGRFVRAGRGVEVYDLSGDRRGKFQSQAGAQLAPSLTDLGHDCDIVISTVPDIAALQSAAIGDEDRPGFALALQPGSLIVHFGGGPFKETVRLTAQLGNAGIGLIDALTCADVAIEGDERLEMIVGGFDELVERAQPSLELLGTVTRVGATGAATGLAALRGYVRAARLIALSEAMLIGRHAGIDTDTLSRVFDGPIAAGPACSSLTGGVEKLMRDHDLASTCRALNDAVAFSERIGVSGECVAFARDMLSDAFGGASNGDESTLLRHFTAIAAADT
ncbi:MAG: NAD(P)-dependent oxidoreductase [Hyphomicrobiaceae bacterium]|nr:NAD(P)-dependent oxidoreductase [Hyphomicrobiaceae bacterium]MCC0011439.1 NAD(P)-dependent oxidoreductase [Hyphomicrobiaceae bacterium]